MRIALYGAPGRIGVRLAAEAIHRHHHVTAISRTRHGTLPQGVRIWYGDAADGDDVARIAAEHDVVVSAMAPDRASSHQQAYVTAVKELADNVGTRRLVVIGGSGSLQVSPGLRQMDVARLSPDARREAETQLATLELLRDSGGLVDWLYVSPAFRIGPGKRTGVFRIGHDVPIGDWVSYEDFAVAVIDELETPRYRRTQINVAGDVPTDVESTPWR